MISTTICLLSIGAGEVKDPDLPLAKGAREVAAELSRGESQLPQRWRWLAQYSIAGNEVWRFGLMAATLIGMLVVGRLVRLGLEIAARRFDARRRDLLAATCRALAKASGFFFFVLGYQVGRNFLILSAEALRDASLIGGVLATLSIGYIGLCLVAVADHWLRAIATGTSRLDQMLVPMLSTCLRLAVGCFVLVEVAAVFERPITPLLAGLGVGGLAIGLAAQDTIKNFFGSVMLFSDRPFELGDEIKVDTVGGTVESVGFRSTRLRTAEGYLVAISNGELAGKTITNISKRPSLFGQFSLPLNYDLGAEKLERAVAIVTELLRDHEGSRSTNPPRVYLGDFKPSSVTLSINYWYYPTDWWRFVAFNQRTNLEILRRFAAEGIQLAAPTQSIRLVPGPVADGTQGQPDEQNSGGPPAAQRS